MNAQTEKYLIDGPAGKIEIAIDRPDRGNAGGVDGVGSAGSVGGTGGAPRGLALVAHPHPLFGGSMDNKVAQTLARTLVQLGYVAVRSNFRGVGLTDGEHDGGCGEQDDLIAVINYARTLPGLSGVPLVLAGFSFGTFVLSHVARRLRERGDAIERMVFVGTAASRWQVADVPLDTIVIHGELDDTVPIASVYDWARPQALPVIVIPGAEHFFHRKLHILKRVITDSWRV